MKKTRWMAGSALRRWGVAAGVGLVVSGVFVAQAEAKGFFGQLGDEFVRNLTSGGAQTQQNQQPMVYGQPYGQAVTQQGGSGWITDPSSPSRNDIIWSDQPRPAPAWGDQRANQMRCIMAPTAIKKEKGMFGTSNYRPDGVRQVCAPAWRLQDPTQIYGQLGIRQVGSDGQSFACYDFPRTQEDSNGMITGVDSGHRVMRCFNALGGEIPVQ